MKLTNKQLKVITNSILRDIRENKKIFIKSEEFLSEVSDIFRGIEDEIVPLIQEYKEFVDRADKKEKELKRKVKEMTGINLSSYKIDDIDYVKNRIEDNIKDTILRKQPWYHTIIQIEESVIIAAMENSENLIDSVKNSLNIEITS